MLEGAVPYLLAKQVMIATRTPPLVAGIRVATPWHGRADTQSSERDGTELIDTQDIDTL